MNIIEDFSTRNFPEPTHNIIQMFLGHKIQNQEHIMDIYLWACLILYSQKQFFSF
jgi:hypothetical protein